MGKAVRQETAAGNVQQRLGTYILWGAVIGFKLPLTPFLLLAILQFEALTLASIVVFGVAAAAAAAALSYFLAASTLLGGLIGYWIWKARMGSAKF